MLRVAISNKVYSTSSNNRYGKSNAETTKSNDESKSNPVLQVEIEERAAEKIEGSGTFQYKKYFRKVKINSIEINGMIDPGSSVCVIKDSVVKNQDWPIKLKDIKLYGFGNVGSVSSIGVLQAKVSVDSVFVDSIDVCVVPDNALNVDVLIGRTFTDHPSIVYYRVDDRLNFVRRSEFSDLPSKIQTLLLIHVSLFKQTVIVL